MQNEFFSLGFLSRLVYYYYYYYLNVVFARIIIQGLISSCLACKYTNDGKGKSNNKEDYSDRVFFRGPSYSR